MTFRRSHPTPAAPCALAVLALLLNGRADAAPADRAHGQATFLCRVTEAHRLEACKVKKATKLDPDHVDALRRRVEDRCPQYLTELQTLKPGQDVEEIAPWWDTPGFWAHDSGDPAWLAIPSTEDLLAAYPHAARARKIAGAAVVRCTIAISGAAQACDIVQEDPPGYGFGAAAVRFVQTRRFRPRLVDCAPVAGGVLTVPIRFVPPER